MNVELTDEQIKHVTDKVAYKKVTIKDCQRYLLNNLSLTVDEELIKELYNIRIKLFHGSDYDSNYEELSQGIIKLFDLLDRVILSLFGLKGIIYRSKIFNYKQAKL